MKYLILVLLLYATTAAAVVDPDAPAHVRAFHERMAPYHAQIRQGQTTAAMSEAYVAMAEALDRELNTAYRQLMARLSDEQQAALRASQRQWLKYRDAEFAFLNETFTRQSHGSSVVLTVGGARNALVYERVEELWSYLESF